MASDRIDTSRVRTQFDNDLTFWGNDSDFSIRKPNNVEILSSF